MHNSRLKRWKWLGNHFNFLQITKCFNVSSDDGDNYHWKPSPLRHPSLRKRESIPGLGPSFFFSGWYKKYTKCKKKKKSQSNAGSTKIALHESKKRPQAWSRRHQEACDQLTVYRASHDSSNKYPAQQHKMAKRNGSPDWPNGRNGSVGGAGEKVS